MCRSIDNLIYLHSIYPIYIHKKGKFRCNKARDHDPLDKL